MTLLGRILGLGWMPPDVSTYGPAIDSTTRFVFYTVGSIFILTEALLVLFVILYRRKGKGGGRADYVAGNTWKQLAWILIPVIIVTMLDLSIEAKARPVWRFVKESLPKEDMTVKVRAVQFGWEFIYPGPDGKFGTKDDLVQTNTLVVPANRVVRLIITSKDVIHSFYIPVLRFKQDAVPGREIPQWFEVTQPGKYEIACSQLCGILHWAMKGILIADTPEEYQQWVNQHWPAHSNAAPVKGAANTIGVQGEKED